MTLPGRLVLLGHPVAQSRSPRMQNAALRSAGLPLRYEAEDVLPGAIAETVRDLVRARAAGNVTYPHKEAVYGHCEALSPLARRVGAVNTFWTEDGALHGDNTDVGGFRAAAEHLVGGPVTGTIALLGAGGAAAAVCAAVTEYWPGTAVRVWARGSGRAAKLAERFSPFVSLAADAPAAMCDAALVVHATPLGMRDDDPLPVDVGNIPDAAAVLDLVYRPGETALVRAARARGHRTADGLDMLVEQGALAFERWFGIPADREAMWKAVR